MSPTQGPDPRSGYGWTDRQDGTGVASASEVWARLRHAIETGTVLETLVALTTPEVAIAARFRAERSVMEREIAGLKGELARARSRVAELEAQVVTMRASAARDNGSGNPLYRRVGLHQNAPAWVVAAVRRAYRAKLHPDAHPKSRRAEAEKRFKEVEAIFDEITKLRSSP